MKKTLFAILALSSLAMGDVTKSITLPGAGDYAWVPGSNSQVEGVNHGIGWGVAAENVAAWATYIGGDTGWFSGTGQSYDSNSGYASETHIHDTTPSFDFMSRPGLSGTYVAMGIELEENADNLTLTFANDKKVAYSVWAWDGTTATNLAPLTSLTAAGTQSVTYDDATLAAGTTIYTIWESKYGPTESGGTVINVTDIAMTYTVPEPTTATLSLLALAGLAARRRRK